MGIAAAEAAIVVSFIIAVFRKYHSIDPDDVIELQG
jgi:NADH:ubiquinone oxidoreductase subunit K